MKIYKITNIVTNKIYIGKTIKTLTERMSRHFWSAIKNSPYYLHKSIKKYGKENFIIEEIEVCNSLEQLNEREIYWIKELNSKIPNGYNMTDGGEGADTFTNNPNKEIIRKKIRDKLIGKKLTKKHIKNIIIGKKNNPMSDENRQKISIINKNNKYALGYKHTNNAKIKISKNHRRIQTEETKLKLSQAHTGKTLSQEHCKKISELKKGNTYRKGKKHSKETIEKMKKSHSNISEETRLKMKLSHLGKKHTEEHREKIRISVQKTYKLKQKNRR